MNHKHGHTKNGKRSSEYRAWEQLKQRCQNFKNPGYYNYGGRGIKVCKRWQSFENFFADMGARPEGLTLDRTNNDGNYKPENCRWVTRSEQNNNRRTYVNQFWFVGLGPNGEKVLSNNQSAFVGQYRLDHGNVARCLRGECKTHKGWRFIKYETA